MSSVREKYEIGNKAFTKADFYRICIAEKIKRLTLKRGTDSPLYKNFKTVLGMYIQDHNRDCVGIYLRCFYHKRFDLETAMHELGHHFLMHLGARSYKDSKGIETRKEMEADYFAELAIGKPLKRKSY